MERISKLKAHRPSLTDDIGSNFASIITCIDSYYNFLFLKCSSGVLFVIALSRFFVKLNGLQIQKAMLFISHDAYGKLKPISHQYRIFRRSEKEREIEKFSSNLSPLKYECTAQKLQPETDNII